MKKDLTEFITPPKKEKLHENIVMQIKNLIYKQKLNVGDKLPSERELSKLFNVSRVVVRESLRSLEQSGIIEIKPGNTGGPFVSNKIHKPIFDIALELMNQGKLSIPYFLEARQSVERVTAKRAAEKASDEDIKRLKQINIKLLKDRKNPIKLREHNTAFHIAIAEIAGNPLLKLMIQSLLDLLGVVFPYANQSEDFIKNTYERHVAIIEAIEQRDSEKCEEMMMFDAGYTANLNVDD